MRAVDNVINGRSTPIVPKPAFQPGPAARTSPSAA
jgi:hypothetical protein